LARIYEVTYEAGGLGNDAEYPLCLAYAVLAVRSLFSGAVAKTVFDSVGSVGVAVGFDSGDFILLGRVAEASLLPLD
jgi:hypothetical protein